MACSVDYLLLRWEIVSDPLPYLLKPVGADRMNEHFGISGHKALLAQLDYALLKLAF